MKKSTRLVATGVTALALAAGIGAGIATADPSSPAPSPTASASPRSSASSSPSPKADPKTKRSLAARALHGEATLAGKKHRVVVFQRGTVDQVSSTSLTVLSPDGFRATYVVGEETKVRVDKAAAEIGDVETADRVRVVATRDGATLTATRLVVPAPR